MAKNNGRYQTSLRSAAEYIHLLHKFDDAVEKIWPEAHKQKIDKIEGTCKQISQEPGDLKRLVLASYRLMKYIRVVLISKRLPYREALKYPNLYTALEHAVAFTTRGEGQFATEADKLEAVSRAAYHWLKSMKKLGRQLTESDVKPTEKRKSTWQEYQDELKKSRGFTHCVICKQNPAADDSDMLCYDCSGLATPKGKCSLCKMPCKPSEYHCDLCLVGIVDTGKPTTLIVERPSKGFIGSPMVRGPFDHIDAQYPSNHLKEWGDIMLPSSRWSKVQ